MRGLKTVIFSGLALQAAASKKREPQPWYSLAEADAVPEKREPQPWYSLAEADAVPEKREPQPWYSLAEADAVPEKREPQPWYSLAEADAVPEKREPQPWYSLAEADAAPVKREPQPWYSLAESDALPQKREPQPWYSLAEADAAPVKREPQPWYSIAESDATSRKREPQPWYSLAESDAVPEKREPQPWYSIAESDAGPRKREPQPWYSLAESDALPRKREPQPWYSVAESDAQLAARDVGTKHRHGMTKRSYVAVAKRASSASLPVPAILARYLQVGGVDAGSLSKRSLSLQEHKAQSDKLKDWVFGTMRKDTLRETSDRGRKLLEFDVSAATDRVDREHVPEHLVEMIENAINDQERVSLLNYYLQVTGREPRPASELGWNRTLDEPTLLENDEVGYGYALGSQHQHHCANVLADAIDLGKDNINDFWLAHVVHCIALIKIYSNKLDDYRESVQTLTHAALARLESGYEMADWEDEQGNLIKQGMIQHNPQYSFVTESMCLSKSLAPAHPNVAGWVIFLIIESVVSGLVLLAVAGHALWNRQRSHRAYLHVNNVQVEDVEQKPFLDN